MSVARDLERLVYGRSPSPERIYVSIHDHRAYYLYHQSQWELQATPYNTNRDQLRFDGIPVEWVPGYNGPPTTERPEGVVV